MLKIIDVKMTLIMGLIFYRKVTTFSVRSIKTLIVTLEKDDKNTEVLNLSK